jgi:hypothetical protein
MMDNLSLITDRQARIAEKRDVRKVYFIRQAGVVGPVKIGASSNPPQRLEGLQVWSPVRLEIAAAIAGNYALEARFHNVFLASHSHGEWFHPSPELDATIAAINAGTFDVGTLPLKAKRLFGLGGVLTRRIEAAA